MDTVALTGAVEAGAIVPMLASSRHFDLQGLTLWIFSLILIGNPTLSYATSLNQQAKELVLSLELGGATQELGQWSRKELEKNFKHQGNSEQAPDSGKTERWTGILLQNLIDQGLGSLPPEAKAEVDLVILKNGAGVQAFIPRAVITKYPLLVAFQKNRAALKNLQTIVPWNSKPKVLEESLPLSRYFVNGLTRIELANYNPEGKTTTEKVAELRKYREDRYEKLLDAVYIRRGWNQNGVPKIEHLKKLGMDLPEVIEIVAPLQ